MDEIGHDPNFASGCKAPKNEVPVKGVIGGYIGIYGDYTRVQGPKY